MSIVRAARERTGRRGGVLAMALALCGGLCGCGTYDYLGEVDPDAAQEFTTTDSGLQYRILKKADGLRPKSDDVVVVHYRGWLNDGTVFDSSYNRSQPAEFQLDRVVPGWTEGLQHVPEGGKVELIIPSKLGYGPRGQRTIPPNATLHFVVELIKVKRLTPEMLVEKLGEIDADAPSEYTTTESGLKYRILRKSDGPHPTADDAVTVHYRGWLKTGDDFDSSYDRNEPAKFPLREVIAGWIEGVQLVGKGGKIELIVPPKLGYGFEGQGRIPPQATLHFVVELIDFESKGTLNRP